MSGLKAPSQPNEYIAVLPTPAGRTPLGHHFLQMFTIHNFWKVLLYLRVVPTVTASGSRGEVEMDRSPTFAEKDYLEFQDIGHLLFPHFQSPYLAIGNRKKEREPQLLYLYFQMDLERK